MKKDNQMNRLIICFCIVMIYAVNIKANTNNKRPNVVFIVIDDMGWKDVGYMGSTYYETPNIDALASKGVAFSNAYAPAANCAPSRACMMSGQNTPRHGIYTVGASERGKAETRKLIPIENTLTLADSVVTIAEALKKEGYRTAQMGKWHIGDDPCAQGFDVNIAGSHAGHPKSYFSPYKNMQLKDGPEGEYLTDRLTDEAIAYIKQNKPELTGKPFFLYLPYYTVHTPLQGKEELIKKYKNKAGSKGQNNPTYAAMIESADSNIGRIMQVLKEEGISDNTMVIFFSDNGGIANISSQFPARAGKGSYYDGGIREPMIISWPKCLPKGKVVEEPVTGLDFYPTILEAANIPQDKTHMLDGLSLMSLMVKNKPLKRDALFWHFPIYLQGIHPVKDQARDPLFRTRPGTVMRKGKWKLHEYFEDGALELYDLEKDPGEWNNLVNNKPQKVKKMHQQMLDWRREMNAPVPTKLNPAYKAKVDTN
jgi:arylsulfatase A-like enzyme